MKEADSLIRFVESALTVIVDALGALAGESWRGPLVVLLFADAESYSLYVAPDDPEGVAVRSGGVCIRDGYVHVALHPAPFEQMQPLLLHEVTHACLSHLNLPLWLEEGITQMAEEAALPNWSTFTLDRNTAFELRTYWRENGLTDFWWGHGFFFNDMGQAHTYRLAQVLFRLLLSEHRQRIPEFVRLAHADDAGSLAAEKILGVRLSDFAGQFLGAGNWEPTPPDSAAFVRRGVYWLRCMDYEGAIADFDAAIRLNARSADAYYNRSVTRFQLGHYENAIEDCKRAMDLDPRHAFAHSNLAWIMSVCADETYLDGDRALKFAIEALELSGTPDWMFFDVLAAASAEAGEFEEACDWAKEALQIAPQAERENCEERLRLFRKGLPYRETHPPKPPNWRLHNGMP